MIYLVHGYFFGTIINYVLNRDKGTLVEGLEELLKEKIKDMIKRST